MEEAQVDCLWPWITSIIDFYGLQISLVRIEDKNIRILDSITCSLESIDGPIQVDKDNDVMARAR